MNGYVENETFGFGAQPNDEESSFNYGNISGLGESNYENEDLFNLEVENQGEQTMSNTAPQNFQDNNQTLDFNLEVPIEQQTINIQTEPVDAVSQNNIFEIPETQSLNSFDQGNAFEVPEMQDVITEPLTNEGTTENVEEESLDSESQNNAFEFTPTTSMETETITNEIPTPLDENLNGVQPESDNSNENVDSVVNPDLEMTQALVGSMPEVEMNFQITRDPEEMPNIEPLPTDLGVDTNIVDPLATNRVDTEFLENDDVFVENIDNGVDFNVVESATIPESQSQQTFEQTEPIEEQPTITSDMMSDTPIEELNKLTEYQEEKLNTTDIKALFNRVGVNVQEASDIFIKNTEMKEKIDIKFEELKKLQAEIEQTKKTQLEEINAYKEEVLSKLTEKKDEIEARINKLKEFQKKLETEKEEFEKFRKSEREEIERVQKEVQEAYDSRREELNHIEDVLRKQKDALDEERSQLSLDRIQYESDKNELANNLLKFNEIVDSFTNGMDKATQEG